MISGLSYSDYNLCLNGECACPKKTRSSVQLISDIYFLIKIKCWHDNLNDIICLNLFTSKELMR